VIDPNSPSLGIELGPGVVASGDNKHADFISYELVFTTQDIEDSLFYSVTKDQRGYPI
jgi:hypothetical protein